MVVVLELLMMGMRLPLLLVVVVVMGDDDNGLLLSLEVIWVEMRWFLLFFLSSFLLLFLLLFFLCFETGFYEVQAGLESTV